MFTIRKPRRGSSVWEAIFDSLADCLLCMDARVDAQITTRRLRVIKYRGSNFGRNEYPYTIATGGLRPFPLWDFDTSPWDSATTDMSRLDDVLGGGYRRGACILFAGLPGTGKTLWQAPLWLKPAAEANGFSTSGLKNPRR
ncbi:hypothetical protein EDC27_2717 [Desulfosoma caldarium]|uniref:Uncharacterized protein n=1 Tax=Desulfosoma caldarium TaxID=610254 RepID=A0A3N1USP5_9BACT|nr:hypothetical protein EDC27_2717 [Desulfosoma caldarium]